MGEWNVRAQDEPLPHEDFDVLETYVHPNYNPANFRNDISLVRLSRDVVFKEHIIPVCLPQYRQSFVGKYARVIGKQSNHALRAFCLRPTQCFNYKTTEKLYELLKSNFILIFQNDCM